MGTMTDEYRRKLIEGIRLVTDACYMQKEQDACTYMCELIPGLSSLAETFPETGVETIIGEALKAMENRDHVLLADILKYELSERLLK